MEVTSPLQVRAVGGGSINNAYHITTRQYQQWFCKINDAHRFPDLFVLERQGLALLEATGMIRVPRVIVCETIAGKQVLVLEWDREGLKTGDFWQTFGRQLAQLHRTTSTHFGLTAAPGSLLTINSPLGINPPLDTNSLLKTDSPLNPGPPPNTGTSHDPHSLPTTNPTLNTNSPLNNYMGALPQSNTPSPDWVEFFRDQRLQPQLKLAVDKARMGTKEVRRFQGLYKALDSIWQ